MNKAALNRWLYGLLGRLALPAVLARMWWRGRREPRYRQGWALRLGLWPQPGPPTGSPRVWLHAVSLGETRACQPLVEALRRRWPQMQLVLTTGTATGWDAGLPLLQPGDEHGWVPLDTPGATRRFFERTRPDWGVLMETETWPCLLASAQACGVPVVLANARLSERSLRKGLRWPGLTRPMMSSLSAVLAQSEDDARRLIEAGARVERVVVCGHLKYDMAPDQALIKCGKAWRGEWSGGRRRVVLAASWREGEDQKLLKAWCEQLASMNAGVEDRPLLLLVPRHPQRFDEVEQIVVGHGLTVGRRSRLAEQGAAPVGTFDVVLGDSLGEMPAYYACADVALLGGSFEPLGGQNLIEAAACECPLLMGPHTFNFSDAARWAEEEGAALRLEDASAAVKAAWTLSAQELRTMSQAGRRFTARHGGAAARMVAHLSAGGLQ